MKKILFALLVVSTLFSCNKLRTSELESEVRSAIIDNFRDYGLSSEIRVGSVDLVHVDGNKYSGIVELTYDGDTYQHTLDVVCDGETFVWEIVDLY